MARIIARLRRRGDGGFTLAEMLVSMLILTGVMAALAHAMTTSLFATRASQSRSAGTQLANEAVEQLQGLSWDSTGFYASDAGYAATYNSLDTVTLPEADPRDDLVPSPAAESIEREGTDYTLQRFIVWRDDEGDGLGIDDADGDLQDNKQIFVEVRWTDRTGVARSVVSESLRTATPDEVVYTRPDTVPSASASPSASIDPSVFGISAAAASPPNQTLTTAGYFTESVDFAVSTTLEASSVRVSYDTTTTSRTLTLTSSDNLSWSGTVAAGSGPFDTGALAFTISAISVSGGTVTQVVEAALTAPAASPIEVTTVSLLRNGVTETKLCAKNARNLHDPTTVRAVVVGLDTNDRVDVTYNGQSYPATYSGTSTTGAAMYDAILPATTNVVSSPADMSVNASRTPSDGVAALQPVSFNVVYNNNTASCV